MGGTVTLSIEVELGWGVHDKRSYEHLSPDGDAERAHLHLLLELCERLNLPISFNVVGHLLLHECDGHHQGPYPEGWFDEDPGTNVERNGLFYAPDVVERIAASRVPHEICTHTFSHTLAKQPAETVAADLAEAGRLHEQRLGAQPVSLVPPRHAPPPTDVITDAGLEIVRVGRDTSDTSRGSRFQELVAGPLPTWQPTLADGIVETYCTTYPSLTAPTVVAGNRRPEHPALRAVPQSIRRYLHRRKLRRAVDRAARVGEHVNLWCHLSDMCNTRQWPMVSRFLGYLAGRRDAGDVAVITLAGLNDWIRAAERDSGSAEASTPQRTRTHP